MLKLTLPEQDDFYADFVGHPHVLRVVALSGGYTREEANQRLRRNHGVVASFSRAFVEGLTAQQSDAEYNAMLDGIHSEHFRGVQDLSEAMCLMESYDWRGNVRELRNIVERLAILCNEYRVTRNSGSIQATGRIMIARDTFDANWHNKAAAAQSMTTTASPSARRSLAKRNEPRIGAEWVRMHFSLFLRLCTLRENERRSGAGTVISVVNLALR